MHETGRVSKEHTARKSQGLGVFPGYFSSRSSRGSGIGAPQASSGSR